MPVATSPAAITRPVMGCVHTCIRLLSLFLYRQRYKKLCPL